MRPAADIRSVAVLLAAIVLPFPAHAQEAPVHRAPRVQWIEDVDWSEIVATASAAGRPILVDFYATWCGPCKLLDAMVYNEPAVIAGLEDVVRFKVDADKARYDELEERFGVQRLPTVIWCEPDGTELDRFTGYVSSREFLQTLGLWRRERTIEAGLLAALEADPRDPAALLGMYRRRLLQGRIPEAGRFLEDLADLDRPEERMAAAEALLEVADGMLSAGEVEEAAAVAVKVQTLIPPPAPGLSREQKVTDLQVLAQIVPFRLAALDTAGALETFDAMVVLDRGHLPALTGFARLALAARVRLQDATTCALRAAIRTDKDPEMVSLLAECYHRRGYHQRAVTWLKEAVAKAPEDGLLRDQLERYEARLNLYKRGYSGH